MGYEHKATDWNRLRASAREAIRNQRCIPPSKEAGRSRDRREDAQTEGV